MSRTYTWTDWADEHPEQAATPIVRECCEHEDVAGGYCNNCGDVIEDWEPTDAEIFAHYGQTKIPGNLAA